MMAEMTPQISAAPDLFDLQATHNPHRWYLPVEEKLRDRKSVV